MTGAGGTNAACSAAGRPEARDARRSAAAAAAPSWPRHLHPRRPSCPPAIVALVEHLFGLRNFNIGAAVGAVSTQTVNPIAGAGGVRCGRSGLVRLTAAGRAPRLRRAGGGGVTAGRVRFTVRVAPHWWAAALPRPLRYTQAEHDMASMRPLRAPCVPSLCAHFGSCSVCQRCARLCADVKSLLLSADPEWAHAQCPC